MNESRIGQYSISVTTYPLGTFFFQTKIQRLYTAVEPEALFDAENHLDF